MAQISYDLLMGDDMEFVEGCFRLSGGPWQVVIVSKRDVAEVETCQEVWGTGTTGVSVRFPRVRVLNSEAVERILSALFSVPGWELVRGPDSMQLR